MKLTFEPQTPENQPSIYELAGGEAAFFRLVQRFYQGVAEDPILRPLYPEDMSEAERNTALFLIQFCGGPATYSAQKGHPRLRMRHYPFAIGKKERDAWVFHMNRAVESEIENEAVRAYLHQYFERTATFLINSPST
ncbi:hemoglobin [Abditibacterium utsteinense]|uniref:Hemoglobin n=1 Tax=Abditibacterium utsteinense TaxID=1960156 RepID=A0A2S8STJ3_9BACT|nr:globin [Abditibacterium utsteinense]PQV64117.1 hemoglobin [Abditibacterium utsteinense]